MIDLPTDLDVSFEVGAARFSTYLAACEQDKQRASRLYMWNLSLSAKWWGPLSYLEVALRNMIHDRLGDAFERDDWWNSPDVKIGRHLQRNIDDAKRYACGVDKNSSPSPNDLVAASSFGLWTSVLHKDNAQSLWRNRLAPAVAENSDIRRGKLYDDAYRLKKLRDRIAHHEPIFKENQSHHVRRLDSVLGVVSPELPDLFREWFPGLWITIEGHQEAVDNGRVDL